MEIDLERARRAVVQLGAALETARGVVRPGPPALVRIRADDRVIEIPSTWAVAGAAVLAVFAMVSAFQPRHAREREEEPLGIG
ncbi:MAG: hypothetical protein HY660_09365 [Armatimonadetes bacterium]|nr:hypothetical protein [Armatimonadota bacterium]